MNYKCVGLIGWGKSCQSLYNYLIKKNIKILIWDDKSSVRELLKSQKKDVIPIEEWYEYEINVIVVSPGISLFYPFKHPVLRFSEKYNIPIYSDIELFYNIYPHLKYIGITGSNGKSTVASLLYHILSKSNLKVALAGNIGTPVFDINARDIEVLILELSSYQLSLFKNVRINYAIILDITPDHLEYHHTFENYITAKGNILNNQLTEDIVVLSRSSLYFYKDKLLGKKAIIVDDLINEKNKTNYNTIYFNKDIIKDIVYSSNLIIETDEIINLPGKHNKQNIAFCYVIAKEFNIPTQVFSYLCSSFKSLEHRQQFIRCIGNITFINDSKATNIEAAEKALINYDNIYWIVGGVIKTKKFIVSKELITHITQAFIIGRYKELLVSFCEENKIKYVECKDLRTAVNKAYRLAYLQNKKATVLLSPAAASFDEFQNFEDRGQQFVKLVEELS